MLLRTHALDFPDKPAVILAPSEARATYSELEARSNQVAWFLRSLGLRRGGAIAVCLENCLAFYEIYWAAIKTGLYMVPVSSRLTLDEVAYIIENAEAKALFVSPGLPHAAAIIRHSIARVSTIVVGDGGALAAIDYQRAIDTQPTSPVPDESPGIEMMYSSGTTGRPKGIRLPLPDTWEAAAQRAQSAASSFGFSRDSIYLSTAPLYHTAPLRFTANVLCLGGTCVVMEKFDAEQSLALIQAHKVSHAQWVPTMFVRMLRLPEAARRGYDLRSLQCALHAAAPCPVHVKEQMIEWFGPIVTEYYGGSESIGSTRITAAEWLGKKGSVGRANQCILHIVDEHGEEVPAGTVGTVYFEGKSVEYYKDPEKTAGARLPNGWSTIGDIGYVDEDGYLFLTDRRSFVIVSGGVNIYPQEIEDVLSRHPAVADVAVFGVPNEEFGEEVKAIVQPESWSLATPQMHQELLDFCRANLSSVKLPRTLEFEPALPRDANGKLYKKPLRDRYWGDRRSRIV